MKIAIVGAGNVGKALGAAWKAAKHDVTYALREGSDKAKPLREDGFAIAAMADAAKAADVIVLAIPFTEIAPVIEALGPLKGKIVIDATNPVSPDLEIELGFDDSAGETVALLAQGARVVKAFNTTGAENMAKAKDFPAKPAMFVAGDDADAKEDRTETRRGDRLRGDRCRPAEGKPLPRADGDAVDQARIRRHRQAIRVRTGAALEPIPTSMMRGRPRISHHGERDDPSSEGDVSWPGFIFSLRACSKSAGRSG